MRTHRDHPHLVCWTQADLLAELVKPSALCAARIEAVLPGGASMDLTFVSGDRIAVVPCVLISEQDLEQRENSPFVWPAAVANVVKPEAAQSIEALLLPWIESLTLAQQFTGEVIRIFGDDTGNAVFDRARAARFLGAARYVDVLADAAPYAYAARFADAGLIAIADSGGALGAVMLRRHAAAVRANLQDGELHAFASRWYAADIFGECGGSADVSIAAESLQHAPGAQIRISLDSECGEHVVSVATPVPRTVMLSFDPEDAPVARTFTVDCDVAPALREVNVMAASPVGGSSGRILLLLRSDWRTNDDADSDDALALAELLSAEGFQAELRGAGEHIDPRAYDLVHAFAAVNAAQLHPHIAAARAAGVPVVLTPALEDVCAQGAWGTRIVPSLLRIAHDETELSEHLHMLQLQRLEAPGVNPKRQEPFAGYEGKLRELLAAVDAVLVSGSAEEALLRGLGCSAPALAGRAHLRALAPDAGVAHVAGTSAFVLVHAPIEPRNNQYLIARAAAKAGLPVLLAGPVADIEYYQELQRIAGDRLAFLPKVSPNLAQALYRSARVYVDLAFIPYGLGRIAAAAASGAALVLARGSHAADFAGDSAWLAERCAVDSIAVALGDAWMQGAKAASVTQPREALQATVAAYAAASQVRVGA